MELVPTQDDVVALLRRTGGLRDGHFEYSGGQHITEYLQVALTMRDYQAAKVLSVGLSRKVRANPELQRIFEGSNPVDIMSELDSTQSGRVFMSDSLQIRKEKPIRASPDQAARSPSECRSVAPSL